MRTIVDVVNHCHTMNVIHRDLKPGKLIISCINYLPAAFVLNSQYEHSLFDSITLSTENFLLSSKNSNAVLKATDFGLSRFFVENKPLDEIVGSPFYVAPEVLRRNYGKEADIWSCGVILYILLSG